MKKISKNIQKKALLKFQPSEVHRRADSMILRLERKDIMKNLNQYQPKLFCINDNERATDQDRKNIKKLYQKIFPYPSRFEK